MAKVTFRNHSCPAQPGLRLYNSEQDGCMYALSINTPYPRITVAAHYEHGATMLHIPIDVARAMAAELAALVAEAEEAQ